MLNCHLISDDPDALQHRARLGKAPNLLNYLAGTKDIPLTLEMDDGPIEIVANIDSSHASNGDYYVTIEDTQEYI